MLSTKSKHKPSRTDSLVLRPANEWQFAAIGTQWWIGLYQPISATKLAHVQQHIADRIASFDQSYSRFRDDSLVARIARSAGTYELPADSMPLFALYRTLYECTDGLVTPLIGQLLSDAGYDAKYSLKPQALTRPPAWDDVLSLEGRTLTTKQPGLLDVGAVGKGYLVDLISELLIEEGIQRFCIDASGDMRCHGLTEPLSIGLEHPQHPEQVVGVANLQQGALCGSAGNRRTWGKFHHIMNPMTLEPVNAIQAVWVYADTAMVADGLATALFFVPPERLSSYFTFAYVVMHEDSSVQYSGSAPFTLFA